MPWTHEQFMHRFPCYNRNCTVCGKSFNALFLGSKRRVTCSKKCSEEHASRMQHESTKKYVKGEKYRKYLLERRKVLRASKTG